MNFDQYQSKTRETVIYERKNKFVYLLLGLASEVGEVSDLFKKHIRDGNLIEYKDLIKELGDVLWYLARISDELDIPLSHIAEENISKLQGRKERGTLNGSGDDR